LFELAFPMCRESTDLVIRSARSSDGAELERMESLELIARVTSHIPDKGQVMVCYCGLYANAPIHPSPGVDVRGRKAASGLCLRAAGPDGGQGEWGVRI